MKYLPFANPVDGKYPETYRIQPGISSAARLFRYARMFFVKPVNDAASATQAKPDRIDLYHGIDRYCAKLHAVAINQN